MSQDNDEPNHNDQTKCANIYSPDTLHAMCINRSLAPLSQIKHPAKPVGLPFPAVCDMDSERNNQKL